MTTATKVNGMGKPKRTRNFGDVIRKQLESDPELAQMVEEARMEADAEAAEYEKSNPQPKRYVPPEHQGCMQLRANKTDRFGVVRSTQTLNTPTETIVTRYCQCKFCGASYQDVTINKR